MKRCFEELKLRKKNSDGGYEIELYADISPYSFGFAERTGIVGGLLYHGRSDESCTAMRVPMHVHIWDSWLIFCSSHKKHYLSIRVHPSFEGRKSKNASHRSSAFFY